MLRFSTSDKLASSRSPTPSEEGFLKLKYDVTFKDWKINVGVVFFSNNDATRSKYNLPGKLIDRLMEYTAQDWVKSYVEKNFNKMKGANDFIKSINDNGGVRKSELLNIFIEGSLNGIIIPFSLPAEIKIPSLIHLEKAMVENFNHATGSEQFDDKAVRSYVNYMHSKKHKVNAKNFTSLNKFVLAFQALAKKNQNSPLVVKNANRVKFLMNSLNWFKRNVYPRIFNQQRKRVVDLIKIKSESKSTKLKQNNVNGNTKILLSTFLHYLENGVDGNDAEHLALLIQIADSKDAISLLGLDLGQRDIEILQKDMQVIIAELNEDLISPENILETKFFRQELLLSRSDMRFNDSNKRVEELWTSEFFKYLLIGDIAIDDESFDGLKNLSSYALLNFDLFCSTLATVDKNILTMLKIYLKKLEADLKIYESALYEEEII